MMPPDDYMMGIDLSTIARRVVQGLDQRNQNDPRGPVTRIAGQVNGAGVTNAYRTVNIKGNGANIIDDPTNQRSTLAIPTGYLYCLIDGGGGAIVAGSKPQSSLHVHDNLRVLAWTMIADVAGSMAIDIRKASFAGYPAVSSIITGGAPSLAGQQKNKSPDYIDPATGLINVSWVDLGWTHLLIGDIVDVVVTGSSTVTRVTLTLHCQALG